MEVIASPMKEVSSMTFSLHRRPSKAVLDRRNTFGDLDWVAPLADLEETDDAYVVKVEVPGARRRDLDISVADRLLTVSAERSVRAGVLRRVRGVRRFHYEVLLPGEVDGDRIDARLDRGVLTVRVPKAANTPAHRIAVRTTD
jgi:HSP20 family protein